MPTVIDPSIFFILAVAAFVFFCASFLIGGHGHHDLHAGHGHIGHGGASHGAAGHSGHTGHLSNSGHSSHASHTSGQETARPQNISPVSLQTLLLFIAGIGVAGYFADEFFARSLGAVIAIAFAGGVALSASGYGLLNYLYQRQGSSQTVSLHDAIGSRGTVLVGIEPGTRGKISCRIGNTYETFSARSAGDAKIETNSEVVITGVSGATVIVEPLQLGDDSQSLPWRSSND